MRIESLTFIESLTLTTVIIVLICCGAVHAVEEQLNDLFTRLAAADTASGTPVLAIVPFAVSAGDLSPDAGRMVAEYAVTFLGQQGRYRLVERMEFAKVVEELEFSQTDMVDPATASEAGRLLSASRLLTGSIADIMGKRLITCRIIHTETGELLASASVTVGAAGLETFYRDALGERAQVSATLLRSLLVPGWGQFYAQRPGQGVAFGVCALACAGTLAWSVVDLAAKATDLETFDEMRNLHSGESLAEWQQRREEAAQKKTDAAIRTGIIGGITGSLWGINLLSAAVAGSRQKKRVTQLYFSANILPNGGVGVALAWRPGHGAPGHAARSPGLMGAAGLKSIRQVRQTGRERWQWSHVQ